MILAIGARDADRQHGRAAAHRGRLRARFEIGRVCVVADRGMISAATIGALEERGLEYILGARERGDRRVRAIVLENEKPFTPLSIERARGETQLFVKEVTVGGARYIVCRNEAQAEKDRADRHAIVDRASDRQCGLFGPASRSTWPRKPATDVASASPRSTPRGRDPCPRDCKELGRCGPNGANLVQTGVIEKDASPCAPPSSVMSGRPSVPSASRCPPTSPKPRRSDTTRTPPPACGAKDHGPAYNRLKTFLRPLFK